MSSSRLVRGAKTRMFAIVCLICVLGAVVFVFHGTQTKLAEVQKLVNSCNQQQESLSAQLQVIFEYKVRLEKSLSKEKEDHKQNKDTLAQQIKDEKSDREQENQEARNKYEALAQQNKLLQNQLDDLKENEKSQVTKLNDDMDRLQKELDQLRKENDDLKEQKSTDFEVLKTQCQKKKEDMKILQTEIEALRTRLDQGSEREEKTLSETENTRMKDELEGLKKALVHCIDSKKVVEKPKEAQNTNVADMPKFIQKATNGSTTPGLNPDAVNNFDVSSPRPSKELEAPSARRPDDNIPLQAKKPTQGSVEPLAFPQEDHQIPGPGRRYEPQGMGHDPLVNTIQKPNTGNAGQEDSGPAFAIQGGEPDTDQKNFAAPPPLDDDDKLQKPGEIPRIKHAENYPHGGDYDRDQPEDEDDEGEQLDYDDHAKKDQKNVLQQQALKNPQNPQEQVHEQGVMVNPK